jgi:hypothetical protein
VGFSWLGQPLLVVVVFPPAIHPTSSCSWAWGRVVGRSWAVVVVSLPRRRPRPFVPPFVRPPPRPFLPRVPAWRPSSSAASTRDPPREQWLAGLGAGAVSLLVVGRWCAGSFPFRSFRVVGGVAPCCWPLVGCRSLPRRSPSSFPAASRHPAIHPASSGSQGWGGCWVVRRRPRCVSSGSWWLALLFALPVVRCT